MGLSGTVLNGNSGVMIEAAGPEETLDAFLNAIRNNPPSKAVIDEISIEKSGYREFSGFNIIIEEDGTSEEISVSPDLAICDKCRKEIDDPSDRRYRYAFNACDDCGPRFTVLERIPYERCNTAMKDFPLCAQCADEYGNSDNRRFHVESISCPECGPKLWLSDKRNSALCEGYSAVMKAAELVRDGKIIALKGLGGFHLACHSENPKAVHSLRQRKNRPSKPFAVMFPDSDSAEEHAFLSAESLKMLKSSVSPVLLAKKKADSLLSRICAPDNCRLGVMIPYTPLHYLLMKEVGTPLIMTSGNVTDEPMTYQNDEAMERLGDIADYFLFNNRRIVRRMDDGIVLSSGEKSQNIRVARGRVPRPFMAGKKSPSRIFASGAELKSNMSISFEDRIVTSNHIGNLSCDISYDFYRSTFSDLTRFYSFKPDIAVCDTHPDYLSSRFAKELAAENNIPLLRLQHHRAHIYSVLGEHAHTGSFLGFVFDGMGYGEDGAVWGGEIFEGDINDFRRIGHVKYFPLIGGDRASSDIRRIVLGVLDDKIGHYECLSDLFDEEERKAMAQMKNKSINTFPASSMGRLFDAAAVVCGFRKTVSFEGEAAIYLESICEPGEEHALPYNITDDGGEILIDFAPVISGMAERMDSGITQRECASAFHNTVAAIILDISRKRKAGTVALSGGVFQNATLVERTARLFQKENINLLLQKDIPANDGGISFGQIIYGRGLHDS